MLSFKNYIFESESFLAWRNHTKTFDPGFRTFVGKNGKEYKMTVKTALPGSMYYNVYHKNQEVGNFYVRTNGLNSISVMNAEVDEKHRRNGIASHVYNSIIKDSEHTGMKLKPQDIEGPGTSDDAKAFWKKRGL